MSDGYDGCIERWRWSACNQEPPMTARSGREGPTEVRLKMAFGGEDDYTLQFDRDENDWDLTTTSGEVVRTSDDKKSLIPVATEMAKPGDTLTIENKQGGVVKDFEEPRL